MRLSGGNDKTLQSNLRILQLCSRFKTIQLNNIFDHIMLNQKSILENPKFTDLKNFLKDVCIEEARINGEPYVDSYSEESLASVVVPNIYEIPNNLGREFELHQKNAKKLNNTEQTLEEHEELRDILSGHTNTNSISTRQVNLRELRSFLADKNHTKKFQDFSEVMQTGYHKMILLRYKSAAKKLAESNKISTNTKFTNNLNKLFDIDDVTLGLKKEFRGRFVADTVKAASIAAIAGLSAAGASGLFSSFVAETKAAENNNPAHVEQIPDDNRYSDFDIDSNDLSISTDEEVVVIGAEGANKTSNISVDSDLLPISNGININSYSDAGKDFIQKVSEIYKYNTGEDIDLSDLGLKNIGYAETTIYTATLGDQVYRFSGMGTEPSNNINLENALTSLGAEVTKSKGNIVYITPDGEKSIAICDSMGNPVKSGNVMSSGGMYNQQFIVSAKADLEANGIDTEGMSEQEFIGYYLLSNNDQNEELSIAMGPLVPLARQMDNTFRTDKSDPYTVQIYAQMSEEIGNDFNTSTMNQGTQTYDIDYTTDNNPDYDYDER